MIPFSLSTIAPILKARHVGTDCIICTISIHSSLIESQCMYIALLGKNFDGHDFAEKAVFTGAKALLVNHYLFLDIPQLIVVDTRNALIKLASWVCQQTSAKVIAITGSSGKTSVKEMTTSILKSCGYSVVSTRDNFNNTVGVPLTLLRLTKEDDFAIIELGISMPHEMSQLVKVIPIDVALINNVFPAHISGFKALNIIKQEKGKIFLGLSALGIGIINFDNHDLFLWSRVLQGKVVWKFSIHYKIGVDFFASDIVFVPFGIRFVLHTPCGIVIIFLPMLLGYHNVANAIAASVVAFSVGASLYQISVGLKNTKILLGRLLPIVLRKGKLLLDDTYNSNVGSMMAAIRVLHKLPGYRILVTSDMLELGMHDSIKYHCYIGRYIAMTTNIDQVFTIGDISSFIFKFCKRRGKHFRSKRELSMHLKKILGRYDLINILIKGSRNFKMEQVVHMLLRTD